MHSLESDCSNGNKIVWNKLDEQISALPERKGKGLVNISTCNLHVCYNAFQKVLQGFEEDLSELVISLCIWFKLSASRRENYEEVQESLACWLINLLWLRLFSELLNSLMILNNTSLLMSLQNSLPFCIIKRTKKSVIKSSAKIFWLELILLQQLLTYSMDFLCSSKKDKPLIHILHSECVSLVLTIMGRFLKWEVYAELGAKELRGTRIACCNQLHDRNLALGEKCKSPFDVLSSEHKEVLKEVSS